MCSSLILFPCYAITSLVCHRSCTNPTCLMPSASNISSSFRSVLLAHSWSAPLPAKKDTTWLKSLKLQKAFYISRSETCKGRDSRFVLQKTFITTELKHGVKIKALETRFHTFPSVPRGVPAMIHLTMLLRIVFTSKKYKQTSNSIKKYFFKCLKSGLFVL